MDMSLSRHLRAGFAALTLILSVVLIPTVPIAQSDTAARLEALEAKLHKLERVNAQDRGLLLYRAACADCHGIRGDGVGLKAAEFAQRPTDFTLGVYKFRSTTADLPLPGDIERSILEGMPGTEMVPFKALLSQADAESLAAYLRTFSDKFDAPVESTEAVSLKRDSTPSAASISQGKTAWEASDCADCHEANGAGTDDEEDDAGFPLVMNDFRTGVFKSGLTGADLYRSIATGMKGTTMGPYAEEMDAKDIWAMVDFIQSMEESPGFFGWLFAAQPSRFDYRDFQSTP